MVGTASKYKEEEEEDTTTKYTSQQECNKRGFDLSFRQCERITGDEDDEEEVRKSRKNCPTMVDQHRLRGKPEV